MKKLLISAILLLLVSNTNATTSLCNWQTGEEWTMQQTHHQPVQMQQLHCNQYECHY